MLLLLIGNDLVSVAMVILATSSMLHVPVYINISDGQWAHEAQAVFFFFFFFFLIKKLLFLKYYNIYHLNQVNSDKI